METYTEIHTDSEVSGPFCPEHAELEHAAMALTPENFPGLEIVSYGGYGRGELEAPELDSPAHCLHNDVTGQCAALLDVRLTDDGLEYVAQEIFDTLITGDTIGLDPDSIVWQWHDAYQTELEEHFSLNVDAERVHSAYVEAQLWTGTINYMTKPDEFGGECLTSDSTLDSHATEDDISAEDRATMAQDVENFLEMVDPYIRYFPNFEDLENLVIGHDFSLTRNHHGVGFWDRGLGDLGDWLTRVAQSFETSQLDGVILLDPAMAPDYSGLKTLPGTLTVYLEG